MRSDAEGPGRRVLLAVLVHNGWSFVPQCLRSAAAVNPAGHEVNVLVLDDCSPEPGFSDKLQLLCAELGHEYYRSPRNLGIPRNMTLGLLHGEAAGYDHVVILNSDLVLPVNFVEGMLAVVDANERVGTITAWSNNVSIYSLVNRDAARHLGSQEWTDWTSEAVASEFGPAGVEIPVGVGFCMLVPIDVVRTVGVLDPVYGRGYCEEVDFCLRCKEAGLRNLLAPNVFVYHREGSASTRSAGLLKAGESTVVLHERIVDSRYPLYRSQVEAYHSSRTPDTLRRAALGRIMTSAVRDFGYVVEVSWLRPEGDEHEVRVRVEPSGVPSLVTAYFRGFEMPMRSVGATGVLEDIQRFLGAPPRAVSVRERGLRGAEIAVDAVAAGVSVSRRVNYPERV